MKIKIVDTIVGITNSTIKEAYEEIAGTWVDVETEHLFNNQYNVTTPSGLGLRVMQKYVEEVENDVRHGKMKCSYCYHVSLVSDQCEKCGETDYLKPFDSKMSLHVVEVNSNWVIFYTTQYGQVSPYGYGKFQLVNRKTGRQVDAQKWDSWSTLEISEKVPQSVKNSIRGICKKRNMHYRTIREGTLTEKTW